MINDGDHGYGWGRISAKASSRFQHVLDKITPYYAYRWVGFLVVVIMYGVRVTYLKGFYIVTYGLGIYLLNRLIGFLSPQFDPEFDNSPSLPTKSDQEFKPFIRRLPEFKFWYSCTKAFCISFLMTFFPIFDVPVFWPILLMYWTVLFFLTMKRQIRHMIKHKYLPFSYGKRKYKGGKAAPAAPGAPPPAGKGNE
eukprot:CAMPEP_0197849868 /NCGR_PEP_ID=MMETSP1438-20131217/13497_1 /TAXON_ID=1461541 /ORGANISM="Pterosperma sp., Strain CCMP1384" /LENGTH=194 /DNA_ID=CAMNT_0043462747 /DNA_START=251 /DNA_END=835 /DNA_ORIENTATION=+